MNLIDYTDKDTLDSVKRELRRLGHRIHWNKGSYALGTCRNEGCEFQVELTGPNFSYHFIDNRTNEPETTRCGATPEPTNNEWTR